MEMGVGKNLHCRHPATKVMAEREATLTKGGTTCLSGCRVPDITSAAFERCFDRDYCSSRAHFLEQEEEKLLSTGEHFGYCYVLSRPSVSLPARSLSLLL